MGGTDLLTVTSSLVDIATDLDMNSNQISNLADPTSAQDGATKAYVDGLLSSVITVTDGSSSTSLADNDTLTFNGTANEVTVSENSGTITIGLPNSIIASVTGNLTGDVTGNLTGDVTGAVSSISNHSTSNLSEGLNLYYTNARVMSFLNGSLNGSIIPNANETYDLGSNTYKFRDLYLSGSSITLGTAEITSSSGSVVLPAGSAVSGAGTLLDTTTSNTDDLAEGSVNLYYTDARARSSISATGSLGYNSSTGVISFTQGNTDTVAEGSTNLYYTNTRVQSYLDSGVSTIATSGNLTVGGNLTVSGTTTTINTETINLADNTIVLNSNETSSPTQDSGIEVERGTSANKTLVWNETNDYWTIGSETFVAGTFSGTATEAQYADLAEKYTSDNVYSVGTVMAVGGVNR